MEATMTDHCRFANPEVDRTCALDDALRASLAGGSVMLMRAVAALGAEAQREILAALRRYDAFDADTDRYGEHDFGAVEIKGTRVIFKIDDYDRDDALASPEALMALLVDMVRVR
jgi:hypothetical protein